jgi:hypothetical protein
MRNGDVIAQQAGATPLPALRSWLDEAMSKAENASQLST